MTLFVSVSSSNVKSVPTLAKKALFFTLTGKCYFSSFALPYDDLKPICKKRSVIIGFGQAISNNKQANNTYAPLGLW